MLVLIQNLLCHDSFRPLKFIILLIKVENTMFFFG